MDAYEGDRSSPFSLHKYLYVSNDSVDRIDPAGRFGLEDVTAALGSIATLASQASLLAQTVFGLFLVNANRIPQLVQSANNYITFAAGGIFLTQRLGQLARNLFSTSQQYPPGPGPRGLKIGQISQQNLSDTSKYLDDYNLADDGRGIGIQIKSTASTDLGSIAQFARSAAQDLASRTGQFTVTYAQTGQTQIIDAENMPYRGLPLVLAEDQKSFTPSQLNAVLEKIVEETGVIIETVEAEGFVGPD